MSSVKTDRILQASIGVLLAALVAVIAVSVYEKPLSVVEVGDTAPEFSIATDNGRPISRSNFGGKLLVLNFWATWCPPCIEETPSLSQFARDLSGSGVVVLGISVDKNEKAYREFIGRTRPAFLTARDPDQKINWEYGTIKYPETYVIDGRGKVVQKIIGPTNWTDERMVSYIKSLL